MRWFTNGHELNLILTFSESYSSTVCGVLVASLASVFLFVLSGIPSYSLVRVSYMLCLAL